MSVRPRGILLATLIVLVSGTALAAQGATKDEAVSMVKKAVPAIKRAPIRSTRRSATTLSSAAAFISRDCHVFGLGRPGDETFKTKCLKKGF